MTIWFAWATVGAALVLIAVLSSRVRDLHRELARSHRDLGERDESISRQDELGARLIQALDAMTWGVVITDPFGTPVFRNAAAAAFEDARHGNVLVAAAIDELGAEACGGSVGEREVDVYGPPRRSHVVRAFPLWTPDLNVLDPIGALVLVEESTERNRIDQVRRDFVANISHELRTPVGALGLLAETIQDEPDPATIRRLAGRMVAESDRVASTIEDLLELSRIEVGDDSQIDHVDAAAVVAEARSRIAAAAEQAEVSVRVNVLDGERCQLMGDRRQLVSAVYNLLDNAVKFSPAGSTVTVTVDTSPDGSQLAIAVADEGIGIPQRDLDRIFERFYRVDRARSRETGGTGLGLAIVRHVAVNHGGDISVQSVEGNGSTFRLDLPTGGVTEPLSSAPTVDRTREVQP